MGLFDDLKRALVGEPKPKKPAKPRKRKRKPKKKKEYQPPAANGTIVIEYLNYAGELKQFIGDPKSIVRKGNHFSVRVAPTFTRISLDRSKTRILKGVTAPAVLPSEPLPVRTTTADTSIIRYTNWEGINKEFKIITGVVDDKGDYVRVRVSPTFKYITLKRTRIGNPEALFNGTATAPVEPEPPTEPAPPEETTPILPPAAEEAPATPAVERTVSLVITGCGLATYDARKILEELRPNLGTLDRMNLLRDFPKTVAEDIPTGQAEEFRARLEDAGCTVEIKSSATPAKQEDPPGTTTGEAPVKTGTVDVMITGCGISTYAASKVLQELNPGLKYMDIYKLLRDFPQVAFENQPPNEAEDIKARLVAAECSIELRPHGP